MPGAEDNSDHRRREPRDPADRILEEMLREIGAGILDEPVPERLRRVLRPKPESGGNCIGACRKPGS